MSLKSMTAYGNGTASDSEKQASYLCEIKTLNSRYLELKVRLPRALMALEPEVMSAAKARLTRGKVDIVFTVDTYSSDQALPQINEHRAKHVFDLLSHLSKLADEQTFKKKPDYGIDLVSMLNFEGVIEQGDRQQTIQEQIAHHRQGILDAFENALDLVVEARQKEGEALFEHISCELSGLEKERQKIEQQSGQLMKQLHDIYINRLETIAAKTSDTSANVVAELPNERLMAEIIVLTEKSDITEELTRLKSHIEDCRLDLNANEPIGRKLDFLCQEMMREVNTIASKLSASEVNSITRNMKQHVERIRQQVQNIE